MRTNINVIYLIAALALLLIGCKPENNEDSSNDGEDIPTVTVPKKYLTQILRNDDPEKIILSIDWNEDCSRINHVKSGNGNGHCVDYDFEYYNSDSIVIRMSLPSTFSYPSWQLYYDSVMVHLREDKIDSICCFESGLLRDIEHYIYDKEGRLIERSYLGIKDTFEWENENVVNAVCMLRHYSYTQFTDYYDPQCNLPFYLSNFVSHEDFRPLFFPMWKNQPEHLILDFEADEDNYVIKAFPETTSGQYSYYYTYYYTTPKTTLP